MALEETTVFDDLGLDADDIARALRLQGTTASLAWLTAVAEASRRRGLCASVGAGARERHATLSCLVAGCQVHPVRGVLTGVCKIRLWLRGLDKPGKGSEPEGGQLRDEVHRKKSGVLGERTRSHGF